MLGTYFFQALHICYLFFLSNINLVVFICLELILPVIKFSHPIFIDCRAWEKKRHVMTHTCTVQQGNNLYPGFYPNKDSLFAFIFLSDDHQTKDGRTVLLSSTLGISRSVAVAIAYYMWNKKVSLKVTLLFYFFKE